MKKKILALSLILAICSTVVVDAQDSQEDPLLVASNAYRLFKDIDNIPINVPTVVEVPLEKDFIERLDFAVYDKTASIFEPHFFKRETLLNEVPVSAISNLSNSTAYRMLDKDLKTYADFLLPQNTRGQVQITLSGASPITSSFLTVLLDNNVSLPTTVEIRALVDGRDVIVVANKRMLEQTIRFPKTTSLVWNITFTYGQPLRISELQLNQANVTKSDTRSIRFLAQPNHAYRIYLDPDRSTKITVGESGNLSSNQDVISLQEAPSQNNPGYVIADSDEDGVPDIRDNCVYVDNLDQIDVNNNGRGDVCDDFDQDGVINSTDNCPDNPNRNQKDTDSDGIGDVCDEEESRITEKYPWIPWVGMSLAAIILTVLFILTARSIKRPDGNDNQ